MRFAYKTALICLVFLTGAAGCSAERILWAKGATHFGHECPPSRADSCILANVASPDHQIALEVRRTRDDISFEVVRGTKHFRLSTPAGMDAEIGWYTGMEILWAPNSSAVSLAWSENAITLASQIYVMTPDGPIPMDLGAVMADLVKDYPPCVGNPGPCPINRDGKDYNYLTVGWAAPHTVALMGEVGESSSFGRNMAKVNGYEVDVPSGRIVRVLKPKAFKERWQSHMGWAFNVRNANGID